MTDSVWRFNLRVRDAHEKERQNKSYNRFHHSMPFLTTDGADFLSDLRHSSL
jgi:hypothetical protein